LGGHPGQPGRVTLNGKPVDTPKGIITLHQDDILELQTPGGGGFDAPRN
jgi:N-methylhydantoinase B/oxoprolinase/acetone carboxylase alpha subunit